MSEESKSRALARIEYERKMFPTSPWWAIENGLVFTEDEHAAKGEPSRKPFPAKAYLHYLSQVYQRADVGMIMKSRQLMMTWFFCWLLLHEAISTPGALCIAQGKREEDVLAKGTKALMGRIKFMRRNLPKHLQPVLAEEASKSTEVYAHSGGQTSAIMAIPQGEDIIRSLTASRVFMDELEFHPQGEAAWTAALPTVRGGGKLWGVTTPNGRGFCYRQADDRLPWDVWRQWPAVMEGLHGYQNSRGTQLIALHYSADEEKRSPAHQEIIRRGYTNVKYYRQENELDFSIVKGEGVYAREFNEALHVMRTPFRLNRLAPIYRGWDFGYNGQVCNFFQHNLKGQLVWFDCVFYQRQPLPVVITEVQRRTMLWSGLVGEDGKPMTEDIAVPLRDLEGNLIAGASLARTVRADQGLLCFDFGDPAGESKNSMGTSDRDTLMQHGIILRTKTTTNRKRDIVEQLRALLLPRSDGSPALLVADGPSIEMSYVIEGFKGGYHYPEKMFMMNQDVRASTILPAKDGFYDHIFDGAQYAIDHVRPIQPGLAASADDGDDSWKATEWFDNPLQGGDDYAP